METASLRPNTFAYITRAVRTADAACCGISLGLLLLMALHWHRPGATIASVDIAPQIDYWWQLMSNFLPWNDVGSAFGSVSTGVGVVPYLLLGTILQALVGASWAQVLILWLLLSASWVGTYMLARRLNLAPLAALIVAAGYTLNPYQQLQISVVTFAWMLAVLPWLALILLRAMQEPQRRASCTIAASTLTLFALSVMSITPQLLFELSIDVIILLFCFMAVVRLDREFWTRFVPVTAGSMLIVSLWWLVPLALGYHGTTITHPLGTSSNAWIYQRASLLENLRFTYSWAWPAADGYFPFTEWYDANPLTYIAGFTLFAGACASMLAAPNGAVKLLRRLFIAALAMMFIAKGVHPPLGGLNDAFLHLPLMFLYQEPAGGTALATLALAICTGFFLQRVLDTGRWRIIVPAATIVLLGCSAAAMITGELFHGADYALPSMYVRVPSYWYDAARYMHVQDGGHGQGTALVLPANTTYQAFYSFGFYGVDAVPGLVLQRPIMNVGASLGYFSDDVQASLSDLTARLIQTHSVLLPRVLQQLGIRYVLVRGDVISEQVPTASPQVLARVLKTAPRRFGPLSVFTIPPGSGFASLHRRYAADAFVNWSPGDREEGVALFDENPGVDVESIPAAAPRPSIVDLDAAYSGALKRPGLPVRVLWRGAEDIGKGAQSVANMDAAASFARIPADRNDAAIPLELSPVSALPPLVTPHLDHIVTARDSYNALIRYRNAAYKVFVMNPSRQPVQADMSIAFTPPAPAQATLSDAAGANHRGLIPASSTPLWTTFEGVALKPGLNELALRLQRVSESPAFASARVEAADGYRQFAVAFDRVRPARFTVRDPNLQARLLGGVPVGARADGTPVLSLDLEYRTAAPRAPVGLVLQLQRAGAVSACYSPVLQDSNDLAQSVVACLRDRRIPATYEELQRTEIVSAELVEFPDRVHPPEKAEEQIARVNAITFSWKPNALPQSAGAPSGTIGTIVHPAYVTPFAKKLVMQPVYGENRGFAALALGNARVRFNTGEGAVARASISHEGAGDARLLTATDNLSLLGVGPRANSGEQPVTTKRLPLGIYVYELPPDSGLLVTTMRYGSFWSALYLHGFGHMAIHTQANGWRNAWFVKGGGELLVFNDLNILVVLLELGAIVYVALALPSMLRKFYGDGK